MTTVRIIEEISLPPEASSVCFWVIRLGRRVGESTILKQRRYFFSRDVVFFETDFPFEQYVPKSSRDFVLQNNHNNVPVMIEDPLEQHISLPNAEQTTNLETEEDTLYGSEQYGFAETTSGNQLHEEDTPHITHVSATEASGNDPLTQTETVEMPQEVSVPEKSASTSADLNVSNERDV